MIHDWWAVLHVDLLVLLEPIGCVHIILYWVQACSRLILLAPVVK
jgi:hypothetical protein